MFDLNILEDPEDAISKRINVILLERFVDEDEWDDLRPLLCHVLTDWEATADYIDAMVYVITYSVNEVKNWRLFITNANILAFFGNGHIINMITIAERLYTDPMVKPTDKEVQFLPFLAEQFISIFENP